jgi:hypothetical protein
MVYLNEFSPQCKVTCLRFRPDRRGTLRGMAAIVIDDLGIEIREITVHQQGDKRWALPPARPKLDQSGVAIRDQRGKVIYEALLTIPNEHHRATFSRGVIDAVEAFAPTAFTSEAAA